MTTSYYTSDQFAPRKILLRRVDNVDEAFVGGVWRSTHWIGKWMVGDNDFVESVAESEARALAPAAFTSRYFTAADYHPTALLRRTDQTDEAFVNGVWRPTDDIGEWMVGDNDFVDQITESEARALAPAAFTSRYFTSDRFAPPKTLLRRVDNVDEAFVDGVWRPTDDIGEWMVGDNDFVDQITEAEARAFAPAAFS